MTCGRAQEFLAKTRTEDEELVDARKTKLALKDASKLLEGMDVLIAAKGKKVERVDLRKGPLDKSTVERLMIGPTGNLRAPTLKVGRTVLVGFDEESYKAVIR